MPYRFYTLDVFAEQKYCGNQLAVFPDATDIPEAELQQIAREINYSETTFVDPSPVAPHTYKVRIFTPVIEVPFAGHPTLGTAWVIREIIEKSQTQRVNLSLEVGEIAVDFEDKRGKIWMSQRPPTFGQMISREEAASLLRISPDDILDSAPCQVVSTGLPFLIIPLSGLDAVKRAAIDRTRERSLLPSIGAQFTYCFSRETYDPAHAINGRMFAEEAGVPEDPATGSANGCLAAYLVKTRFLGSEAIDIVAEQGYEIARPSLLYLRALEKAGEIDVKVGGKVVLVAKAEMV